MGGFVLAPAGDAGEAHGDAALVAAGALQPLKGKLKYLQGLHGPHRPEALGCVTADPAIQRRDLAIVEAGVGLGETHQLALGIPEPKGVIGEQVGAAATAGLGVEQHRIEGVGVALVLPPVAPLAARQVGRGEGLEHQPFGGGVGGLLAQRLQLLPDR